MSVQRPASRAALYRLDKTQKRWMPIDAGSTKVLFGMDGDKAVVGSKPPYIEWIDLTY